MVTKCFGETSVLKVNGTYFFYVNNWGGCPSVDCTPSEGCASCCYVPPTEKYPDACVFTQNHSVYVYSTTDFRSFRQLGCRVGHFGSTKGNRV